MLRRALNFFQNLFSRRQLEQSLDDELQSSLEILTQEKMPATWRLW